MLEISGTNGNRYADSKPRAVNSKRAKRAERRKQAGWHKPEPLTAAHVSRETLKEPKQNRHDTGRNLTGYLPKHPSEL